VWEIEKASFPYQYDTHVHAQLKPAAFCFCLTLNLQLLLEGLKGERRTALSPAGAGGLCWLLRVGC
jgi:hypothetical protein